MMSTSVTAIRGGRLKKRGARVILCKGSSKAPYATENKICAITTYKLSDALLIASIVQTSIEIDEITETKTNAQ